MPKEIPQSEWHQSQRGYFAGALYNAMVRDKLIFCLTGDLGYGMLDKIRDDFPDRFINCSAAEQALIGAGVGLALAGKKPFCYSITPFLLYRPYETIRTYLNHEMIPVRLVGSGRDKDYAHDGFSHHAEDDFKFMTMLPNIGGSWPETKEDIPDLVEDMVKNNLPWYVNLRR